MKLRLRNLESKETLRIQVPSPCTFYELQRILSQSLPPPPPSRSALRFSRNARHDLSPSSPDASLESLGISSGDLVYFSTNPAAFSPKPSMRERDDVSVVPESHQIPRSSANGETSIPGTQFQEFMSHTSGKLEAAPDLGVSCSNQGIAVRGLPKTQNLDSNKTLTSHETHTQGQNFSNQQESRSQALPESQQRVENEFGIPEETKVKNIAANSGVKKFSGPYFLRKVLRGELVDGCVDHNLMVIAAVHAVLLESGFSGFDAASKRLTDDFSLPNEKLTAGSTISLWYTLPELVTNSNSGSEMTDYIVVKFQNQGNFLNVDGCLVKDGSVYSVCLDKTSFAHCDDGSSCKLDEKVFNFWKMVKDWLALPLSIDLCERSGLSLPACLTRLPTELKLKIVESLPGKALARAQCVCSEMRYMVFNNDLWKQKVIEEFGAEPPGQRIVNWKDRYAELYDLYGRRQRLMPDWHPTPTSHLPVWHPTPTTHLRPIMVTPLSDFEVEMDLLRVLGNSHDA